MKPPIILDNRGDIRVFPDLEKALGYTEVVDVEDGEYKAYDSEGRLLTLGTRPRRGFFGGREVVIDSVEAQPLHQQELRATLIELMRRIGASVDPNASLDTLVNALVALRTERRK